MVLQIWTSCTVMAVQSGMGTAEVCCEAEALPSHVAGSTAGGLGSGAGRPP